MDSDVIILGAGASGLMAARELARAGVNVRIFEARDRLGGRILSVGSHPPIELGAEFLHGNTPVTDRLTKEFDLPDALDQPRFAQFDHGRLRSDPHYWGRLAGVLGHIHFRGPDRPFAHYLQTNTASPPEDLRIAAAFVEGFDAADLTRVSTRALQEMKSQVTDPSARRLRRLVGGYGELIERLARPLEGLISLSHPVREIEWSPGEVRLSGRRFSATSRAVIVTVPISLLTTGAALRIHPLPVTLSTFLSQNALGQVTKVVLELEPRFFDRYRPEAFPFVVAPTFHFTTWWGSGPVFWPTVTAWAGGARARTLNQLSPSERRHVLTRELARIVGCEQHAVHADLRAIHEHSWSEDTYAHGAYRYPLVSDLKRHPPPTPTATRSIWPARRFIPK